jgi:acyl-CoA reductase-like NAD-dependent aldehyde dehydrogenase
MPSLVSATTDHPDAIVTPEIDIDMLVARASRAQEILENWTEEHVDRLLHAIATTMADAAEPLAIAAVDETGFGNVGDKTMKNRFASLDIYDSIVGRTAHGVLASDPDRRVTEVASPVGVVFGVVPVTTPVATAVFKTMISIKARNALIMSFHHRACRVGAMTGSLIRRVLVSHGAPADLVQWLDGRVDREATRRLMSHPGVALVLATGGAGLVRAAYSSGKPAIGVGPGNAPAWICADADAGEAARAIVSSKAFDNGLICGAEHNLVVDERVRRRFVEALEQEGAAVLASDEERRFVANAIDVESQSLRSGLIGRSPEVLAAAAGITRPYRIRLLVVPANRMQLDGWHAREKLAPLLSMFTVVSDDEGLNVCRTLLRVEGAGHTAIIHTTDRARVERFAVAMPAGRILVNVPGAQGCCGIATGLDCSMTLGCGTFGGNSTTDNVTYRHLLNIKRIAYAVQVRSHDAS